MCEFVSWLEVDGKPVFLTSDDLESSLGRALREEIKDDVCGHGAIRRYFDIPQGVGVELENTDLSDPAAFPVEIVEAIKAGKMRGIAALDEVAEYLLSEEARAEYEKVRVPAWAEYNKVRGPALAEYEKVRDQARAEYEKACVPARAEYEKVRGPAWAEYNKVRDQAWAEYDKVRGAAWAECEKVRSRAFWGLFAKQENRAAAWR